MQYSCTPSSGQQTIREMLLTEVRQYQLYPFIMLLVFSLAIISRISEAIDHNKSFFTLRILHVIAMTLQGPLITLVFSLDYDTRKQICNYNSIRNGCFYLVCFCKRRRVTEYEAIVHEGRNPHESLYSNEQQPISNAVI